MKLNSTLSCILNCIRFVTTMINKKIILGLLIITLLAGCSSPTAMLGPVYTLTSTGNVVQAGLSYGSNEIITMYTGKTPLEHAIAYADKKNPEKKKEACFSFIEKTNSEFCTVVKKQISLTNTALTKKTSEIVQKFPKIDKSKETSLIENIARKSVIYNRR